MIAMGENKNKKFKKPHFLSMFCSRKIKNFSANF